MESIKKDYDTKVKFEQIFETIDLKQRKTKIICTMGPSCWDVEMLVKMLDQGMDVCRLNFSHGDHKVIYLNKLYLLQQTHGQTVDNLKEALKQRPNKTCAIMLDTKGPEIRTGQLRDNKPVDLVSGQELNIVTDYSIEGDNRKIACSYKNLPQTVSIGSTIFIADGSITAEVIEIFDVSYEFLTFIIGRCQSNC